MKTPPPTKTSNRERWPADLKPISKAEWAEAIKKQEAKELAEGERLRGRPLPKQ
jgi:hypothetical protein